MFLFYHSQQKEDNINFFKGNLFETLLKNYLTISGYDVTLRKKSNSLEYDIEGINRTTKHTVIGEAKAHTKNMSGQIISSFVGKLIPLGLMEKKVHGLFLSTSALTAEAEDYFSKVENLGITCKTGQDLFNDIHKALGLPALQPIEIKASREGYDIVATNILQTDTGIFLVYLMKLKTSGTPAWFTLYSNSGDEVTDLAFIDNMKSSTPELAGFEHTFLSTHLKNNEDNKENRDIPSTLRVAREWDDYRLPAGPSVFVGREVFIKKTIEQIKNNEIPNIIQIKSRSGVGKSSVLSYIDNVLKETNIVTEIHDSRDIKTIYDVYSIVSRFVKSNSIPLDFTEIEKLLIAHQTKNDGKQSVILVDQFESTFVNPDIFHAYETLATIIANIKNGLYLVLARKNDQLTTYDDTKISLTRINSLSINYVLPDFERSESITLMEKINASANNALSKEILPYVIEFAQGFPWLLKRTMAHILKLTRKGSSHKELISSGLKLDDLFEEELEGLDEIEKDYLTKIASKLPAGFKELQIQFDEDPMLVKVLDKLTESRLLRLSGDTYDTYNDVFKEYLVYKKLPEFRPLTIYRMSPSSVLPPFHKIIKFKKITIHTLSKNLDVSEGHAFNLVKELRSLDLLQASSDGWIIPTNVKDIYTQGGLSTFIRKKLLDNDLVSKIITCAINGSPINENELPKFFIEQYPFIEASEKTWRLYSTTLKSWLVTLNIIDISQDGKMILPDVDIKDVMKKLGNLNEISGRTSNNGLFLPVTSFSKLKEAMEMLLNGKEITNKELLKAKLDLANADILVGTILVVSTEEELKDSLYELLNNESLAELWEALRTNSPCLDIFNKILGGNYAQATLRWRLRKMSSLAKAVGLIPNKRSKYI
jgi:hypothetical protein